MCKMQENIKPGKLPLKKRVRFSYVTEYRFKIGYGGSSVPLASGPSIGLVGVPVKVVSTLINSSVASSPKIVKKSKKSRKCGMGLLKFNSAERTALLKKAGYASKDITAFCVEALDIRISRDSSLRDLRQMKYFEKAQLVA